MKQTQAGSNQPSLEELRDFEIQLEKDGYVHAESGFSLLKVVGGFIISIVVESPLHIPEFFLFQKGKRVYQTHLYMTPSIMQQVKGLEAQILLGGFGD